MDTPDEKDIGAVTAVEMARWREAERRAAFAYGQGLAVLVAELYRVDKLLRELLRHVEVDGDKR